MANTPDILARSPVPLDANGEIDADTPCISCGYNIRGLPWEGQCPECGAGAMDSLSGRALRFVPLECVAVIRRKLGTLAWASAVPLLVPIPGIGDIFLIVAIVTSAIAVAAIDAMAQAARPWADDIERRHITRAASVGWWAFGVIAVASFSLAILPGARQALLGGFLLCAMVLATESALAVCAPNAVLSMGDLLRRCGVPRGRRLCWVVAILWVACAASVALIVLVFIASPRAGFAVRRVCMRATAILFGINIVASITIALWCRRLVTRELRIAEVWRAARPPDGPATRLIPLEFGPQFR